MPVDYLDAADRLWFLLAPLMRGHAAIYRASGGRVGGRLPGLPSLLLLDHVGAKSGKRRTTPLVYMPDGDNMLVVASKGGYAQNPGWLHNLRAHPNTEVQIGGRRMKVRAREADAEERRRLWPQAAEYNPHWARYRTRTSREIPLVLLEPSRRHSGGLVELASNRRLKSAKYPVFRDGSDQRSLQGPGDKP